MNTEKNTDNSASKIPKPALFDRPLFGLIIGLATLIILCLIVYFVDFTPSLKHLHIRILSGSKTGNYYAVVEKARAIAEEKGGNIENLSTNGSADNIKRLQETEDYGTFALVQNGMPWGEGFELVARLPESETVFFIGPDADKIKSFADIRNMRIGIGPEGSGTAYLAETLFSDKRMKGLNVKLSNHSPDDQIALLKNKKIDLAIFVISESSEFIEKAVRENGMRIASFRQSEGIAKRLPFLRASSIREGYYDPIKNLPAQTKMVVKVDTLVLCKEGEKRSRVISLLSVLNRLYPDLVSFNKLIPNNTGLYETSYTGDYLTNNGPEFFDRYIPKLIDLIPLGNLVQIGMVVSILFNLMGVGNRFFLWRIDANRVSLESETKDFFGSDIIVDKIGSLELKQEHRNDPAKDYFNSIIQRFEKLKMKCRKRSQSFLVPMGTEMAYRYQEDIIRRNILALKEYQEKMGVV